MDTETKTTQQSDCVKEPYQTPELVVMGDATEMTQLTPGVAPDLSVQPESTGS